ncbi:MAG: NADH-quinone oxidoreductase subunit NuoG, partial [Neisseriaceae bacterium]|nr:NADH-quinone oxidoreductase subunit NuoG [Neisseriaceae bacterium]
MLQVEIDGKSVEVEQGTNIIEAAHKTGTYIPHFCYHKKLSIAASCRMCLVEVEKAPKPQPACATPVTDGMKVKTNSELAQKAQKGVLEFLLINHPLDCPICDWGGECQLQDLVMGYGQGAGRFSEEKHTVPAKNMGPLISAEEMSRCIHCTRCVRFTEEVAGFQEIAMANRNENAEIMPFIGKTVTSEISGNVIDLCPVGALTSKPFRYNARSWELSRRKSISAHDALGSNLIVQTKDRTVRRVIPLENESINECWLSDKDRFAYEGLNHENRLQKPMIKQDNQWIEVDWETAFNYVVKGLNGVANDHGKNAIGMWVNPASTVEELFLAKKIAADFGIASIDSRLRQQDYRLDENRHHDAFWLGQKIEELGSCDAMLFIGADLRTEQPLLTARIRRAAQNGAKVSTLSARREELRMPTFVQAALHPTQWVEALRSMLKDTDDNS